MSDLTTLLQARASNQQSVSASQSGYEAVPLLITPERAHVVSALLRALARHEGLFTDYQALCGAQCLRHDCETCAARLYHVAATLTKPDSLSWEVWTGASSTEEAPRLVGLLYLTQVVRGCDAHVHYVFFDERLRDKTDLLEAMVQWAFTDHPDWPAPMGWKAVKRLTVEVPAYASALASHANRRLGFGGPYRSKRLDKPTHFLHVEGAKRAALRWRGADHDLLLLGRLRPDG